MKVLIVSNMYPGKNKKFEYAGVFVKEQVEVLRGMPGIDCELYIINGFKSNLIYFWSSIFVFFKVMFGRYDVVHVHYGLSALFTFWAPFKKWRNVILTLHGGDILAEQGKSIQVFLTKKILSRVGKVITLNENMNDIVSRYREDFLLLPCGVDMTLFCPDDRPKRSIVVFPGRIDRDVKNFPLFKKVVSAYVECYENVEIEVLDGLTRNQVRDLMLSSQVLLMTSLSEGSPQAVKEAMSCDLPVVSSNVGDVSEILGGVEGTSIFELDDSPEFIAGLVNHAILESDGTPGARRERISELKLDNLQIVDQLVAIYKEVAENEA